MRELTGHKVNEANDQLTVEAVDEPGSGGACHRYRISGFSTASNPSFDGNFPYKGVEFYFQNGPINESGVNGVTHEALLAILIDRLQGFQDGPYACIENGDALHLLEGAQQILHARTKARMARGVEGTHKV